MAVNRAARLRALAGGGDVYVAQSTAELVIDHLPDGLRLKDLGEHALQGLARPEHIWQLVESAADQRAAANETEAVTMHATSNEPWNRFEGPFVGRTAALASALEAVEGGWAGLARVVLVSGEPGVGKSRLAREVTGRVPHRAVWSSCWEGDGAPPFWPWLQVLRSLRAVVGVEAATPSGDHGSLGELLGVPAGGDAQTARFRRSTAFADVAAEATLNGPLLVVIDDLQWADSGSLRLLRFLCSDVRGAGLAVIATCREADASGATAAITDPVGESAPGCLHLRLRGLAETEVAHLCEQLGAGDLDAAALHRRSGGNPFCVREFIRLGAGAAESVPASVEAVVALRLDAISVAAPARRWPELQSLVPRSTWQLWASCSTAIPRTCWMGWRTRSWRGWSARLVRRRSGSSTRLCRRSSTVASAAATGPGCTPGRLRWWSRGRRGGRCSTSPTTGCAPRSGATAGRCLGGAGGRALVPTLAYEHAAAWYGHALASCRPGLGPGREAELLIRRGEAALAAGDLPDARDAFRQAAVVARNVRLRRAGRRCRPGSRLRAVVASRSRGTTPCRSRCSKRRARGGRHAGRPGGAVLARLSGGAGVAAARTDAGRLTDEAIELARDWGPRRPDGHALAVHCDVNAGPDWSEARRDEAGEIVELARRTGDRELELLGRRLRLVAHLELGDVVGADQADRPIRHRPEQLRQPLYLGTCRCGEGCGR